MSISFFYILEEKTTKKLYAGSKYGKNTDPHSFMTNYGYKTSSTIINKLIIQNGLKSFEIKKLRIFNGDKKLAFCYETRFLNKVDAKRNDRFYNKHNNDGIPFYYDDHPMKNPDIAKRCNDAAKQTKNSHEWKSTIGKESSRKMKQTKNSDIWKSTVGKIASEKRVNNTNYDQVSISNKKTKADPMWKETIGKEATRKQKLNTDYVKLGKNMSKIRQSNDWKLKNTHICNICYKNVIGSGNLKQHMQKHGAL